jgi:DNA polymerase-3 subunit delta
MSEIIHAFDFLKQPPNHPVTAFCVMFGDEPFLKKLVMDRVCDSVLGESAAEIPFVRFEGDTTPWTDVLDELSTRSLFGSGQRLAVVEAADRFVSRYRAELEDYSEHPKQTGTLVLQVDTWQANSRLYKYVAKTGLPIECRAPQRTAGRRKVLDERRLLQWIGHWCKNHHEAQLAPRAAELLFDLVGPSLGMLDQELAKLALFAGLGGDISEKMVADVVGGWRTKTTWELIDAAVDGDAAEALRQLDQLLQSGENPLALFGPISWSLRRFAMATRIIQRAERNHQRISLPAALEQAGFRKWPREAFEKSQQQLRQLGRERAGQLQHWLLEADLALKGSHSSPTRARFVLETLVVRMSTNAAQLTH